jgi:hypothetical protein
MLITSALLFTSAILQQANTATEKTHGVSELNYGIGTYLGNCQVVGCQVFSGYIAKRPPEIGQLVDVIVTETILGPPPANPVALEHPKKGKNGFENLAWSHATISPNVPVTVIVPLRSGAGVAAGHPLLVTSNKNEDAYIRIVVSEIERLKQSPERVFDDVASLSTAPNRPVAGYLVEYLTSIEPSQQTRAELLGQLLTSTSMPANQLDAVAITMTTNYSAIPAGDQAAMVRQLAGMARSSVPASARAGFHALSNIARYDQAVLATLPPEGQASLAKAYSEHIRNGNISRLGPLEPLLGGLAK